MTEAWCISLQIEKVDLTWRYFVVVVGGGWDLKSPIGGNGLGRVLVGVHRRDVQEKIWLSLTA